MINSGTLPATLFFLAMNQALSDIEKESNQEMGKLTGGMGLGF